jgi:hypothetical protein
MLIAWETEKDLGIEKGCRLLRAQDFAHFEKGCIVELKREERDREVNKHKHRLRTTTERRKFTATRKQHKPKKREGETFSDPVRGGDRNLRMAAHNCSNSDSSSNSSAFFSRNRVLASFRILNFRSDIDF